MLKSGEVCMVPDCVVEVAVTNVVSALAQVDV